MTAVSCERRSAAALSSVNRPARYELSHNIRFADMVEPMFDASDCGAGWIFSLVRDVAAGGATTSRGGSWQPRMRKRSRNEIASCSALQIPRLAFQDWRPQTLLAPKSTPAQWLGSLELGPGLASCGRHARCALGALSLSWFAFQRLSDEDFAVVGGNLQAVPTLSLTRESPVKWKIDSWRTPPLSVTAIFIAPPSGSERNSSTESFL